MQLITLYTFLLTADYQLMNNERWDLKGRRYDQACWHAYYVGNCLYSWVPDELFENGDYLNFISSEAAMRDDSFTAYFPTLLTWWVMGQWLKVKKKYHPCLEIQILGKEGNSFQRLTLWKLQKFWHLF